MINFILQGAAMALGAGLVQRTLLKKEAPVPPLEQRIAGEAQPGVNQMSYDIVGNYDDEMSGSIGYEIVSGDDDFSGDGSSEIIGARGNGGRARVANMIRNKNAVVVTRNGLDKKRRFPLGFVATSVGASLQATILSAPQNLFRTERFVIPSDIAFSFSLTDIKVGNESQLVSGAEIPAAVFTEVAIDTDVSFKTAEVGNQVSTSVINLNAGAAVTFRAALIGTALRS